MYAGGSLDLKFLHALEGRNQSFYGRNVSTEAILSGQVEQPMQARELYQCLDALVEEN
jgi:lipid-binding SYLF domain-containing protein